MDGQIVSSNGECLERLVTTSSIFEPASSLQSNCVNQTGSLSRFEQDVIGLITDVKLSTCDSSEQQQWYVDLINDNILQFKSGVSCLNLSVSAGSSVIVAGSAGDVMQCGAFGWDYVPTYYTVDKTFAAISSCSNAQADIVLPSPASMELTIVPILYSGIVIPIVTSETIILN